MAVQQGTLAVRPETQCYRPLSDDEYARLRGSVAVIGQLHPILLFEGAVLDGVHRLRVCEELGIEPQFRDVTGEGNPVELVQACNEARRQLSTYEIALLASERATATVGGDRHRHPESILPSRQNGLTRDQAAAELGVSPRNVDRAREIQHPDVPEPVRDELDSKLRDGQIGLTKAAEIASATRRAAKREAVPEGLVDDVGAKVADGRISVERVPRILNHAATSSEQRKTGRAPHPAKFSAGIVEESLWLLPAAPAQVLDPFAGVGGVHDLRDHGFDTAGVEIEPEWANQHEGTVCGDSRSLSFGAGSFDAILTSPTYGNLMAEASVPDLTRGEVQTYAARLGRAVSAGSTARFRFADDGYRTLHEQVWAECWRVLRSGGILVLNTKDPVVGRAVVPMTAWHCRCLIALGFEMGGIRGVPVSGMGGAPQAGLEGKAAAETLIAFHKPD